jgi:hypothetical protein
MTKATPKPSAGSTNKRLKEFESERSRAKTRNLIIGSILFIFTIVFGMMLAGDRFAGILALVGLKPFYFVEGGAYADCSLPENQNIAHCSRGQREIEKNWNSISKGGGKSAPFSLSGP